jgi:hypothetical protein
MTFLQHLGNFFKKALGIAVTVAKDAEPVVDLLFPTVAPLYNSAVGLAIGAEAMAPTLTGTGPQKLAQLVASLEPQAIAWAAQNGVVWPVAEIQKWASAVVDTINLIPAPTIAPIPIAGTPAAPPAPTPAP